MAAPSFLTHSVALFGVLIVVAGIAPDEPARCSVAPFGGGIGSQSMLLGRALNDTLEAGAGGVPRLEGTEDAWSRAGAIRGQVIEVSRHAGADSLALARAFDRSGSTRVAIVPWEYNAACHPIPWTRSAAWVPLAEPGVFTVRLRPDSLWAGGMPTFDAFMARFEPYPHGAFFRTGYRGTDSLHTTNALTPAEYFELLRAIPTHDEISKNPDAAWARIVEWRSQHPDIAARFPATRMLHYAGFTIARMKERQALRAFEPAIAGTWRFTFALNDGPDRMFYARTRHAPTTGWRIHGSAAAPPDPADVARIEGYHMIASGALTADSLLVGCSPGERVMQRESYIAAIEPARVAAEQTTEWPGLVDLRLLQAQFPDDTDLRQFVRDHMMESVGHPRGDNRYAPARFTVDEGGAMRVEQTIELNDGRSVVVRGERVSNEVIGCDG